MLTNGLTNNRPSKIKAKQKSMEETGPLLLRDCKWIQFGPLLKQAILLATYFIVKSDLFRKSCQGKLCSSEPVVRYSMIH